MMPSIAATDSQWWSNTDLLWCCGCCRSHSSGLRCTSAIRRLTSSELLPDMVAGHLRAGVVPILTQHSWTVLNMFARAFRMVYRL